VPDDVATGGVQFLSQFSDVTSLLGSYPLTDPPSLAGKPWLFSDNNQGVLKVMEGTSATAVVLSDFGGWGVPVPLATSRYRRLRADFWIDPQRDANMNVTETSSITANRGMAVFNAAQFRLQRTDPDAVFWGDLCTIGCQLLTEPQFLPVTDGDWLLRGTAYYGVEFTGWSDAAE
jgi:hypothetical protein